MSQGRKKSNRDSEKFIESAVSGVVNLYNDTGGFGIITEDITRRDVLFLISAVSKDSLRRGDPIRVGDEVIYDLYRATEGFRAESVQIFSQDVEGSDSDDTNENENSPKRENVTTNVNAKNNKSDTEGKNPNTTHTKSNTGANNSDTNPNLQPDRRSTMYNYSYPKGSNIFSAPMKNTSRESFGSGVRKQQMPTRSSSGDGGGAKLAGDSKERTKGGGTNDDHVKSTKETTADELPNYAKQQRKGTTASKESQSTGSGNMFKADTEKNPSTTLSSFSRARGNAFFRLARGQRFDMVKSISYKSALACYKKAYNWASRDEDLVSAAENAATTCWRLATLKMATECASYQKVIHEYFKDALQYFGKAYPKRNCKGEKWAKHLEKSIQECLHEIRTWIELKDEDDRIDALTEYLGYLPSCGAKVEGYIYIATIYFKKGKEALKFDEYENCQEYLKDCRVPLGEAEKMCDNVDSIIRLDVTALKKNVEYHGGLVKKSIARARDAQARQQRELAEAKEKEIAMDQLKTDKKQLDLLSKLSIGDFVKQVYQLWPPQGTKETQPSLSSSTSSSSLKKLLVRAIRHYHPDKNVHDIKWQLLSSEITKCLNKRHDIIK
ncbi:uncharacterized protein LOC105444399 [Strongylocentrotus purpuratus]|uniref:Cold-shock domain-containing protein n=1 Tax=Strongylocentrotus purpuratus TaxID=7668 RepID=A0A7M7PSH6_STRPU|nr:uncharacterized protein LOC105444399 [Strongylocentrotus purpuratus]